MAQTMHKHRCWTCKQAPRRAVVCAHATAPPSSTGQPKANLAVFVSGGGSNFKAIHEACIAGEINGQIVAVVTDAPGCGATQYADQHQIATFTYPPSPRTQNQGLTTEQLVDTLKQQLLVNYVLLAGYLKLVPAELVREYPRAMLNIHPALLPAFGGKGYYGQRVHKAVVAAGARYSGATVHFVDEQYDRGPILAQTTVPVYPTDTPEQVGARVLRKEHTLYPESVAALCDGRITWREDGVPIMWTAH